MEGDNTLFIGGIITTIVIVGLVLLWGISIVQYNEYAVEKEFGTLHDNLKETGFTWIGFGSLERINNQIRNYEIVVEGASSDYQNVKLELNLNTQIKKETVYEFLKDYKTEEQYQQYLDNKVQERVKTILLKYNAEDILNNRLQISKELTESVKTIPELKYFTFNDLSIKNIVFGDKFNEALEKKAQVLIEREIIIRQKENLELLKRNMDSIDIDTYFKYQLIEKWNGNVPLIISDAIINTENKVETK
ncbi:MAG: SPFH domain-containing protein [archaeon]|nr:SPFH domain-containing protein [archaeon]